MSFELMLFYYQEKKCKRSLAGALSYTPHSAQTSEYGPVVGLLEHIYRFIKQFASLYPRQMQL